MLPISDILIRSISGYVFIVPVFILFPVGGSFRKPYQMSHAPRNDIAASCEKSVFLFLCPKYGSDCLCHTGLFCDN